MLAEEFSCPVIGDFRVRDMAAGGLGAPLVPYTEFLLYRSETECVALQNIGGIGNISFLPAGCGLNDVLAFDTGPGNMVIDALTAQLTGGGSRAMTTAAGSRRQAASHRSCWAICWTTGICAAVPPKHHRPRGLWPRLRRTAAAPRGGAVRPAGGRARHGDALHSGVHCGCGT